MDRTKKFVRCAIYTRKSTEDGWSRSIIASTLNMMPVPLMP